MKRIPNTNAPCSRDLLPARPEGFRPSPLFLPASVRGLKWERKRPRQGRESIQKQDRETERQKKRGLADRRGLRLESIKSRHSETRRACTHTTALTSTYDHSETCTSRHELMHTNKRINTHSYTLTHRDTQQKK